MLTILFLELKRKCHVMCHGGLKINKIIFYLATSASKKEGTLHLNPIFWKEKSHPNYV